MYLVKRTQTVFNEDGQQKFIYYVGVNGDVVWNSANAVLFATKDDARAFLFRVPKKEPKVGPYCGAEIITEIIECSNYFVECPVF